MTVSAATLAPWCLYTHISQFLSESSPAKAQRWPAWARFCSSLQHLLLWLQPLLLFPERAATEETLGWTCLITKQSGQWGSESLIPLEQRKASYSAKIQLRLFFFLILIHSNDKLCASKKNTHLTLSLQKFGMVVIKLAILSGRISVYIKILQIIIMELMSFLLFILPIILFIQSLNWKQNQKKSKVLYLNCSAWPEVQNTKYIQFTITADWENLQIFTSEKM